MSSAERMVCKYALRMEGAGHFQEGKVVGSCSFTASKTVGMTGACLLLSHLCKELSIVFGSELISEQPKLQQAD